MNGLPCFPIKQIGHCLRVRHSEKLLHEIDGMASHLLTVSVPAVSTERHTAMPLPSPLISGAFHFLMLPFQNIHDGDCIGSFLLLLCKINEISQSAPPLLCLYHFFPVISCMTLCDFLILNLSCQLTIHTGSSASFLSRNIVLYDLFQMMHESGCH